MCAQKASAATKSAYAYEVLRGRIQSGDLKPGQRVTLIDLAEQLEISLTPVREALQLLASQGLVVQESNKYTTIAEFSFESALAVYRLRLVLEPVAADLAASRATDEEIEELRKICRQAGETLGKGPKKVEQLLPQFNWHFHMGLYAAAKDPVLMQFIERLWYGVPYQRVSMSGRYEDSFHEHEGILDALQERDGDLAATLVRSHIAHAARATLLALPSALEQDEIQAQIDQVVGPVD